MRSQISAIIDQVQQPGSVPPEDVPALMTILRSTAIEQLSLVQGGTDDAALQAALGFGRWVKLPTLMLGEARNAFKASKDQLKREEKQRQRRLELGIVKAAEGSPGAASPGGAEIDGAAAADKFLSSHSTRP